MGFTIMFGSVESVEAMKGGRVARSATGLRATGFLGPDGVCHGMLCIIIVML